MLVMWWLFGHHSEYLLAIARGKTVVLSKSDAEFIDYMERSLSVIDDGVSQQSVEATEAASQVVYVPVFTPPATPSPLATLPQTAIANERSTAIPKPLQTAPPEQLIKIPSPPPLPAPTPKTESPSAKTSVTPSQQSIAHTLIGVLELGESVLLLYLKSRDRPKQIWQGQEISNSGWILDSVADQNIQISNRGQVRSLSASVKSSKILIKQC